MPVKSKILTVKSISIDDVIGAPVEQVSSEAPPVMEPPVVSVPLPQSPVRSFYTPKASFIPGPVSSSHMPMNGGQGMMGNGNTDRYGVTPTKTVMGFLDIMSEGHGFLRPKFVPSDGDIYISQSQIRKFQLRAGDKVEGQARLPKENERYLGLLKVERVNEQSAEEVSRSDG